MSSKLERNDKIKLLLHNSHLSYKRNEEPSYKKYFKNSKTCFISLVTFLLLGTIILFAFINIKSVNTNQKRSLNFKKNLPSILNKKETVSKLNCPYGFVGENCTIECGLSFAKTNLKIVGGTVAVPNSWPSLAFILACDLECTVCGGSLIDEYTVLTAAHCIVADNPRITYHVYLGLQDTSTLYSAKIDPAIKMSVKKIIKHENYDDITLKNDIALFILSSKVSLNKYVQVACLPKSLSSSYPKQTTSWAAGWGLTSYEGKAPNQLNNVKLTVYTNTTYCRNVYPTFSKDWNKQICAGDFFGFKDTCQGDSGGPLYVEDNLGNKNKYVVAGIVSYGDTCASAGKPGIYTRVSGYLDWIIKNSPSYPNYLLNSSATFNLNALIIWTLLLIYSIL